MNGDVYLLSTQHERMGQKTEKLRALPRGKKKKLEKKKIWKIQTVNNPLSNRQLRPS